MTPKSENALAEAVKTAAAKKTPLHIKGGGTRAGLGAGVTGEVLNTTGIKGVSLYEPGALTIVAAAGTPLETVEKTLAKENQRLAFEPMDHRALYGSPTASQPSAAWWRPTCPARAAFRQVPAAMRSSACASSMAKAP
jgi:glycolate oxidase FAD binding subunit